jgi:hypothetical protein
LNTSISKLGKHTSIYFLLEIKKAFKMATTIIAEPDLRQTLPFNATADIGPTPPSQLKALIESHPELKIYTPASPSFNDLKKIWNLQFSGNSPLAIIRPTSSSEISSVLKFCSQNNLPVTIRSGGQYVFPHLKRPRVLRTKEARSAFKRTTHLFSSNTSSLLYNSAFDINYSANNLTVISGAAPTSPQPSCSTSAK